MTSTQGQVRCILDYQTELSKRSFEERRSAIYAEHSAKGSLRSGATIRRVVRMMEELGATLVSDDVEKVSSVAKDAQAFAAIEAAIEEFWSYMEAELSSTLNISSGRHPMDDREDSASRAGKQLFDQSRSLVRSKLELFRFTFAKPDQEEGSAANKEPGPTPPVPSVANPKRGGRPPAEFWDDMWAAIATALYSGEFNPKSQADVQRAMSEWIDGKGYSAADSTVKARARRLWDLLAALNE